MSNAPSPSVTGQVSIVGAGPGKLAYLTVGGLERLRQAEVLVADALLSPDLLQQVPPGCDIRDVGKRGGQPSMTQADIDTLLVSLARAGKRVVRLKSGDPFVFGRTASEIQALRQAGCAVEVIPGLSSALAAPLLAGIPLTDPVLSAGFAVFTAHDPDALPWDALAALPALALLMGGRQLGTLCRRLVAAGKRPETPVAIIRWGGHPQQQIWEGTLLSIEQQVRGDTLSPCIIVVGEVVQLRPHLGPSSTDAISTLANPPMSASNSAPLQHTTVLVTRAAGQASQFSTLLQAAGATVIDLPALEIRPPTSWAGLDGALAELAQFHWLILTSANAVNYFMERLLHQGQDSRALASLKLAVVGKKTAAALAQWGLQPDFIPPDFVADSLVEHFPVPVAGLKLLFPRVESGGRDVLVKSLTAAGADVVEVPAYESGCPAVPNAAALAALQRGQVNVITFASSKTVRHTCHLLRQGLGDDWAAIIAGVAIAAIGPKTAATCHELLGRVDIEPAAYTLEALTQEIGQWVSASLA